MGFLLGLGIATAVAVALPIVARKIQDTFGQEEKQAEKYIRSSGRSGSADAELGSIHRSAEKSYFEKHNMTGPVGGLFKNPIGVISYALPGTRSLAHGKGLEAEYIKEAQRRGFSSQGAKEISEGLRERGIATEWGEGGAFLVPSAAAEVLGTRLAARGAAKAITQGTLKGTIAKGTERIAGSSGRVAGLSLSQRLSNFGAKYGQQTTRPLAKGITDTARRKLPTQIGKHIPKISKASKIKFPKYAPGPRQYIQKGAPIVQEKSLWPVFKATAPGIAAAGAYEGSVTSLGSSVARGEMRGKYEEPTTIFAQAGLGAVLGGATAGGLGGATVAYQTVGRTTKGGALLWGGRAMDPYELPGDVLGGSFADRFGMKGIYSSSGKIVKASVPTITPSVTTTSTQTQTSTTTPTSQSTPTETPVSTSVPTPSITPTGTPVSTPTPMPRVGLPLIPFLGGPNSGRGGVSRNGRIVFYDERAAAGGTFRSLL